MKNEGVLLACDRCKMTVFLTKLKEPMGFDIYEQVPKGWYWSPDLGMDLCPVCHDEYVKIMEEFKDTKEVMITF